MAELKQTGVHNYQINQLLENDTYIVLHPETNADVVEETVTRVFVTPAQKAQLQALPGLVEERLIYRGTYRTTVEYKANDVVVDDDNQFYICIENTTGDFVASKWIKVNQVADRALSADTALDAEKLGGKTAAQLEVAYATNAGQAANAAKLNDKLEGELEVAKAVVAVSYNSNEKVVDGTTIPSETINIADKMDQLDQTISGIQGGGTFTANKLTVTKDGANGVEFDGSSAVTVDIKQTYATNDISDLLDAQSKIDAKWLPDSILGQLKYGGTWDASSTEAKTVETGVYYICNVAGNNNPDGQVSDPVKDYQVGDWAVYNGASWDKIDNTDAVTMVNGQIGAVETYKGEYVDGKKYHKGDIAKQDGRYYVCVEDTEATSFNATAWGLLGAQYKGVEGNPVVVDESKFEIKHAEIEVVNEPAAQDITIAQGSEFSVPSIERDSYGHIKKVVSQKYVLDASGVDTVRPVKVNGTQILSSTEKSALDLVDGNSWININNENGSVKIAHKEAGFTALPELAVEANENLQAGQSFKVPSLVVDAAGHITGAELKEIKLGSASIAHNHFEIKTENNVQTIGAYTGINDESALSSLGALKFYQGVANPTATETLKLNAKFAATELYQGANKVLDSGLKVYAGQKEVPSSVNPGTFTTEDILGEIKDGRMELGNSGIAKGVYSVVKVNEKGIVTAGGQMVEIGTEVKTDPSASLAVGGLFFRKLA